MSDYNTYEYIIPSWAMTALVNGDDSGLDDDEIRELDEFEQGLIKEHGHANLSLRDIDGKDNLGFCFQNDINYSGDTCYRMYLLVEKQNNEVTS